MMTHYNKRIIVGFREDIQRCLLIDGAAES